LVYFLRIQRYSSDVSIEYSIDPAEQMIWATASGVVTDQDVVTYAVTLAKDPENHPEYNEILDFSHAEDVAVSLGGLHESSDAVCQNSRVMKKSKFAIVVRRAEWEVLGEMYRQIRTGFPRRIEIFTSTEEACRWIGCGIK